MVDRQPVADRLTEIEEPSDKCIYCDGKGIRTEYVGSRFVGTNPQAHPVTKTCWSCHGSGVAAAPAEKPPPHRSPEELRRNGLDSEPFPMAAAPAENQPRGSHLGVTAHWPESSPERKRREENKPHCACAFEVLPGGVYPERRYFHDPDCPAAPAENRENT